MIRLFEIIVSFLAIVILMPFLLPIMVVLRLTGEGEVFYKQERIGRGGEKFNILKFATMLKDSPNMKNAYITLRDDPRVLPLGKFLRKTKMNELPQLINILKGDISIVGPRPQVESHFDLYPDDKKTEILSIQPGLTGVASIFFRDEEAMISKSKLSPKDFYKQYIVPYKIELELWYKDNQSVFLYFQIIFLTGICVLFSNTQIHKRALKNLPSPPPELSGS
jgi:lipopolysaccharide/colanic/teichoic acid biosynthesis glycosyltransferase